MFGSRVKANTRSNTGQIYKLKWVAVILDADGLLSSDQKKEAIASNPLLTADCAARKVYQINPRSRTASAHPLLG